MACGGPQLSGPGAANLATKVELTISCENLMDMDVFSKSDPLCAVYLNTGSHWYEVCISTHMMHVKVTYSNSDVTAS